MDRMSFGRQGARGSDPDARLVRILGADAYRTLKRAESGGPVAEGEDRPLRQALLGLAPSSAEFKRVMAALDAAEGAYMGLGRKASDPAAEFINEGSWRDVGPLEEVYQDIGPLEPPDESTESGLPWWLFPNGVGAETKEYRDIGPLEEPDPLRAQVPEVMTLGPSPAAEHDAEAKAGMVGGGPMASSPVVGSQVYGDYDDVYPGESAYMDIPEGYAISGIAPGMIPDLGRDPQVLLRMMMDSQGINGPGAEGIYGPYMQAANALSSVGVLSQQGNSLFGGGSDPVTRMTEVEDFLGNFAEPGMQFVNPGVITDEILSRSINTDLANMLDENGNPYGPDAEIEITNAMMLQAAPFLTQEAATYMTSRLEQAALEYKTMLYRGEVSMSYPKYLESIGARDWLQ
jgi:hypothetical protein